MNVGYVDGRFSTEGELQAQMAAARTTNVNVMKETSATYPTLSLIAVISGKRVGMFYLALGIDSNTMLVIIGTRRFVRRSTTMSGGKSETDLRGTS